MPAKDQDRWLLLIHQIPPKPNYFRVKVWRRLQRLGAVAIKNSVYVLPWGEQAIEDFQWTLREIVAGGGEASLCDARFVEGISDEQVEALFNAARDADYAQLAEAAKELAERPTSSKAGEEGRERIEAELARLKRRLSEIATIDFFGAPGREAVDGALAGLEARLGPAMPPETGKAWSKADVRGRTWVTRKGIHVDRMACAWLIPRFIDPDARFKFVAGKGYRPASGELRFDMFEAEFTHEGDRCSFEVLLARFGLDEPALQALAAVVHDIDLKDAKFGRPEVVGIDHLIAGVALAHRDDHARLARGSALFDDFYEYFKRCPGEATGREEQED